MIFKKSQDQAENVNLLLPHSLGMLIK